MRLFKIILIILFLLNFYPGLIGLIEIFTKPEFRENALGFVFVSIIFIFTVIKTNSFKEQSDILIPGILLSIVTILNVTNSLFLNLSLLPAILFLIGVYALLGFFLEKSFWIRSLLIFLILVLTLPILERMQKFFGFPLRLITADLTSYILTKTGVLNITSSAVIITENRATLVDLPCSGVKSLYIGTLFALAFFYLERFYLTIKFFPVFLLFLLSLIFFNVWRVFSLVYIYDILVMPEFGDTIHVSLGVIGFLTSCTILVFLSKKFLKTVTKEAVTSTKKTKTDNKLKPILLGILAICLLLSIIVPKKTSQISETIKESETFSLPSVKLTPLEFNHYERGYFQGPEIVFGKKYHGTTTFGHNFSLLVIESASARSHHDPEICLQALGHKIVGSEIIESNNIRVRKLKLNDGEDEALYWYVGKNKNLLDYSERVWEEMVNPKENWILVIVGFKNSPDLSSTETNTLLLEINTAANNLLKS